MLKGALGRVGLLNGGGAVAAGREEAVMAR